MPKTAKTKRTKKDVIPAPAEPPRAEAAEEAGAAKEPRDLSNVLVEVDLRGLDKFTFSNPVEARETLRDALKLADYRDSEAAADFMFEKMTEEGREIMLKALLAKEAEKHRIKPGDIAKMNTLSARIAEGDYPYVRPYSKKLYKKELYKLQVELLKLQRWVKETGKKIVIIFEGRDAAGKGGTIRIFNEHLNPRQARIVALPKPTEAEAGQWYFQRYAAQLPTKGEILFFDRSWYNRAVVEPVMGFCTPEQTELFLKEVPNFEKSLVESGIILIKFWLSVSQKEQRRRFKEREVHPLKRWKLSPVDVASLSKWDEYTKASSKMFFATDTAEAPWTVIRSDDKLRARINAIRIVLHSFDYDKKNPEAIGAIDPLIVGRASTFFAHSKAVGYRMNATEAEAAEKKKK